jgi:hypothetical protein
MEEKKESTMDGTLEQVHLRMTHLETGISDLKRDTNERQINMENRFENRFNAIDNRFNAIDSRFNAIDNRFIELEKEIRTNFRWMIGMWITVIVMFISTMLTIILKVG